MPRSRIDNRMFLRTNRERFVFSVQGFCVRYKVWRSNKDKELHLLCAESAGAFNALPTAIRHLGPWTGSKEGEIGGLRLAYRVMLVEQGFAVIYEHVSQQD